MAKTCGICNSENKLLLGVPKDKTKQKLWTEALKKPLKTGMFICKEHLTSNDIVYEKGKTNLNCLNPIAVPNDLTSKSEIQVKVEPEQDVSNHETSILKEPTVVKIEVSDSQALELIHEEQFDASNPILKDANKSNDQRLNCGRIDLLLENDTFKLNCIYCSSEFDIFECQSFVQHIKEQHAKDIRPYKPPDTEEDGPLKTTPGDVLIESIEEMDIKRENAEDLNDSTENDDSDYSQENTDEDYEPKSKKVKQISNKTVNKPKDTAELVCDANKTETRKDDEKLITFDTKPQKYLITLLELLKTNAVLWHRRQSILKRFDDALSEVLIEFNKKYPSYQLTEEKARISINRIKELYYRVTDSTHKRYLKTSTHKTRFPEFFEHCSIIEFNSKKVVNSCDKCNSVFLNEIDLQIHKFKRHRIGELPFKCSRCNYGFTNAEKRDEHETKHNRVISHICEICNKGFFSADKLQAHVTVHTNDSKPVCEICGQMFQTYNRYRRHKLHHEPPKEKCNICGKMFYEKWNLSEHVKSHLNERQYSCDVCGKSYNHQNDVTIHKRVVHSIKSQPRQFRWVNKSDIEAEEDADKSSKDQDENSNSENDDSNDYDNKADLSILSVQIHEGFEQ